MSFVTAKKNAVPARAAGTWFYSAVRPELYELVILLFDDGSTRRGTWNGKMWWGYDERVRRSRALDPIAWRSLA